MSIKLRIITFKALNITNYTNYIKLLTVNARRVKIKEELTQNMRPFREGLIWGTYWQGKEF
jgi:HKD family nuclease